MKLFNSTKESTIGRLPVTLVVAKDNDKELEVLIPTEMSWGGKVSLQSVGRVKISPNKRVQAER